MVVTPAVAGPFDLGNVVIRAPAFINLETAQITVKSDPVPTMLRGLPLKLRSVVINVDRKGFILNPTNCEPMKFGASLHSSDGATATPSNRFQVGGCNKLKFKPNLKLSLKGATKRSGHPALKAVVTYPKNGAYSNIARAQVGLPHSEFLDQGNLDKVCTQPQLKSATCPKRSVYGHAKAWTPLLDKPLEGPVYIGVGYGHKLPDLVADLNGQVRILLHGKVDTTKHEGIRNTFEVVPDAPVTRFVLEMKGGKKYGLLENSENICRKTQRASAILHSPERPLGAPHATDSERLQEKEQEAPPRPRPGKAASVETGEVEIAWVLPSEPMSRHGEGGATAELASRLRVRREEIEQATLARLASLSPLPDRAGPGYAEGLRAAVAAAVDHAIATLEREDEAAAAVPLPLLTQARLAARSGVGLDTVARRYVAGHSVISDFVLQEAGGGLPADELKRLLHSLGLAVDRLLRAAAAAYTDRSTPSAAAAIASASS